MNTMHSEDLTLQSDGLNIARASTGRTQAPRPRPDRLPRLRVVQGEPRGVRRRGRRPRGWVVLSFDFRGHGASDGCINSRTIHDVGAALAWLQAQPGVDPARIAVRGSSMGGYFAIHAAAALARGGRLRGAEPARRSRPEPPCCATPATRATFYGQWRARGEGFPRRDGL